MESRSYSNVSTPNAKPLNLAPPCTKPSQHALIQEWAPLMPRHHSSVTKVYASVESKAMAMRQVIFPHQPPILWLVALLVRRHTSMLVRHAARTTLLLTRMTCYFL